jgi:hypothetical protein
MPFVSFGQVDNTSNLGFEKGNFDGWTLSYGNVRLVNNKIEYQNTQNGTTQNRHLIVSKAQGKYRGHSDGGKRGKLCHENR